MGKFRIHFLPHEGNDPVDVEADGYKDEGVYTSFWRQVNGPGREQLSAYKTEDIHHIERLD